MITLDPSRPVRNALLKRPAAPHAAPKAEAAPVARESSQVAGLPQRIANVAPAEVAKVRDHMEGAEYVPGELLVKLNPGLNAGLMGDFASEYGAEMVERFDIPDNLYKSFNGDLVRLKLPAGIEVAEAVAAMQEDGRVVYAEGNEIIRLPETVDGEETQAPNDLTEKLWGLNNTGQNGGTPGADISALDAWKVTKGDDSDNGPLIAVIDTGVDYNHPDLQANMWVNPGEIAGNGVDDDGNGVVDDVYGYNAQADTGDPLDGHSHGTHCAGTIGARGDNGEGVTGVMQKANIMAVKIFSDSGRTSADAIVRGILYSGKMGADITSNSWGGGGRSEAIYDAFASNPALHVIAAGNSNYDNDKRDNFPSNYDLDNIVAVAATNRHDNKASFSQWGAKNVDVAAPGRDIWSTVPNASYGNKSGTSMATPHVSGVAGLIASAYPDASPAEIKSRLIYGSDRVESLTDISVSDGRVNAAAALENDTVAPGTPSDFSLANLSSRGIDVSWATPGDDGATGGPASLVELRYSSSAITDENYAEAAILGGASGDEIGAPAQVSYRVAPSEVDRPVFFAARAVDNVGNQSEMARGITMIPASSLELSDNFDGASDFTPSGSFRKTEVEGRGQVFVSTPPEGRSGTSSELTSPSVDLAGKKNSYLKFDAKTNLYWANKAFVEVTEDGENWTQVEQLKRREQWAEKGVDLSAYDGKSIQFRFRVDTPQGRIRDGLALDNVKILAENA